jgi:hypothetical protein
MPRHSPGMSTKAVLVVAVILAGAFLEAEAGVTPRHASDVITVITTTTACPFAGGGRLFDTEIRSDGSRAPFVIPPGKVFVVTGLEFFSDSTAGQDVAGTLL